MRIRWRVVLAFACGFAASPAVAGSDERADLLLRLCDRLLTVQIDDPDSPDYGALRCPSTNPELHPLHSRAAEAMYPLAVAFELTGHEKYREAAVRLGDWLVSIQQPTGEWGERWPDHDGWTGTTVDQLISLAGAYPRLAAVLEPEQRAAWIRAITRSAAYVQAQWPRGNLNYWPTGAVALVYASRAVPLAPATWRAKADELIRATLATVNADGLLVGEGGGVDAGYNLAQTIGFVALHGHLTGDQAVLRRAAQVLERHLPFFYPNGSVDNSWGTRSYKWTYESGTKTAPGVFFTLALLAGHDPRFRAFEKQARHFLEQHNLIDGWVVQGPHAVAHASTNPPCIYGTFARAQSLAMAVVHAPVIERGADPSFASFTLPDRPRVDHFSTINVAVIRTPGLVATVSAYGEIAHVSRDFVARGGSVTNLWFDGYGPAGFFQTSSVTDYRRQEPIHMPHEAELLPLTPRVEVWRDGRRFANVYETDAEMQVVTAADHVLVRVQGRLRDAAGGDGGIGYTLTHRFYAHAVTKEYALTATGGTYAARVVESVVAAAGMGFTQTAPDRVEARDGSGRQWSIAVARSSMPYVLEHGAEAGRYWSPFPALNAHPVTIDLTVPAGADAEISLVLAAPGASLQGMLGSGEDLAAPDVGGGAVEAFEGAAEIAHAGEPALRRDDLELETGGGHQAHGGLQPDAREDVGGAVVAHLPEQAS